MNRLVSYKTTADILFNDGITPAMKGFRLLIFTVNGILFDGEAVSKSLKNAVCREKKGRSRSARSFVYSRTFRTCGKKMLLRGFFAR